MTNHAPAIRSIVESTPQGIVMEPRSEQTRWHDEAVATFIGQTALRSEDFLAFSHETFYGAPFGEMQDTLERSRPKRTSLDNLEFFRTVLMIARDTHNLADANDLIDNPETQPLTDLITNIGGFIDLEGRGLLQRRKLLQQFPAAMSAVQAIESNPVTKLALIDRATAALKTEELLAHDVNWWSTDSRTFRMLQRSLRQVVHLGIVSQILEPTSEKLAMVHTSVALNRKNVDFHEGLAEKQAYL